MSQLRFYTISSEYVSFLSAFDHRVAYNKNAKRPYIGVVFQIKGNKFFAPLSSPKEKHKRLRDNLDFIKIANGELGVINFNNMIPVDGRFLQAINFHPHPPVPDQKRKYLLLLVNQHRWCVEHQEQILGKAERLYHYYVRGQLTGAITQRCVSFPVMERCLETLREVGFDFKQAVDELKPSRSLLLDREVER